MDVPPIRSVFEITGMKEDISLLNIIYLYIFIFPLACAAYTNLSVQRETLYLGFDMKIFSIFSMLKIACHLACKEKTVASWMGDGCANAFQLQDHQERTCSLISWLITN